MSLEATLILLDNSDHSRNGDYMPTRWDAETDAAALISNAKFNAHPENAVGLMTMAGKQCEILATPTQDSSKIMACLHGVRLGGTIYLSNAIQIAQLALKHRLNKNQRQRILVFIASPIAEDEPTLVSLAKKLKKNNVAVDVINMGQHDEEHKSKLEKFVETVKSADNSNIIHILPGINFVSDSLIGTPILGGNNFGGMGNNEFGGDDGIDPELAMALRISLETERDRKRKEEEESKKNETVNKSDVAEEKKDNPAIVEEKGGDDIDDMDEEEILKRAQELSQQKPEPIEEEGQGAKQEGNKEPVFEDKDFVNDLLNSLGVDQSDPSIQEALKGLEKDKQEKKE